MLSRFFKPPSQTRAERVEDLSAADVKRRLALAKDSRTDKEILYYLAEKDPEPAVRRAVVKNKAMPAHVAPIVAMDRDVDVRLALAGRLVDLLPEASADEQSQLYAFVVQALGTLALDEVLKIRKALSSTLKDHACAPPKIAGQLARDVERDVSEPILRYCAVLSDHDLIDILKAHPASWVIEAVAKREHVSETVSEAVIDTDDQPGSVALLTNDGAELSEDFLHTIIEKAKNFSDWQGAMAERKALPSSIVKELAEIVDASVRDILVSRDDFDDETTEEVAAIFRRRIDFESDKFAAQKPANLLVKDLMEEGALDEARISDALAMRDRAFVIHALALKIQTLPENVEQIFEMQTAKPIVALTWHAGLSMRLALELQKQLGQVQPGDLLYPKDGSDYPLSEAELVWQLEFLGFKGA